MSDLYDIDGLLVDEDGVIHEYSDGPDPMLRLARVLFDCQAQTKGYEQRAAIAKAALVRQPEKTMRYDDNTVSVQQAIRKVTDIEALRESVRAAEMPREDLESLVCAAKDFDRGLLGGALKHLVDEHTREVPGKPYVMVRPVLRPAPEMRRVAS